MPSILKHHFYDIHSHQKEVPENVWQLSNLTFPKDTLEYFFISKKPFSVGLHPWFLEEENFEKHIKIINQIAKSQQVWAIGETGLDKAIKIDFSLQLVVFQKHIEISENLKKPLIVHCVKSYNEILSLHKKLQPSQNWLIHGFRANTQIALHLQEKGIYLSFGEALLKSPKLQETFAQIQPEYFFLETDDSGISIEKIYETAFQIRKTSPKEVQKQIKQNLCKFFKKKSIIS